jgi:hypothetical protein
MGLNCNRSSSSIVGTPIAIELSRFKSSRWFLSDRAKERDTFLEQSRLIRCVARAESFDHTVMICCWSMIVDDQRVLNNAIIIDDLSSRDQQWRTMNIFESWALIDFLSLFHTKDSDRSNSIICLICQRSVSSTNTEQITLHLQTISDRRSVALLLFFDNN